MNATVRLVLVLAGAAAVAPSPLAAQNPAAIPGMRLWLRADAGVLQTPGGAVTQWDDQSGAGDHVAQTAAAQRPTIVTNVVNGLPAVRFDGSQQFGFVLGDAVAVVTR